MPHAMAVVAQSGAGRFLLLILLLELIAYFRCFSLRYEKGHCRL